MKIDALTLPPDEVERRVFGDSLTTLRRPHLPLSAGAIEARNNLERTRLAFEAQQQRKAMPDLKTELTKVINEWNAPEAPTTMTTQPTQPTMHHNVTNNVTRATFEHIRDNPNITRSTAVRALVAKGYNGSSVSSLIGQMIRQRLVREVGNGLFANQQEYTPLRPTRNNKPAFKRTPRPERTPPALVPMPPVPVAPPTWSTSDVIDRLNIKQALAVYDELRKIFGA